MAVTPEELLLTRNRLIEQFGDELVMIASMASFFHHTTTRQYGRASEANFTVLIACIKARVAELGYTWPEFMAALAAHERAASTLSILSNLPD